MNNNNKQSSFKLPIIGNAQNLWMILPARDKVRGSMAELRGSALAFSFEGNFTTALLFTPSGVYVGSTKRNPIDPPDRELGKKIAAIRAYRSWRDNPCVGIRVSYDPRMGIVG